MNGKPVLVSMHLVFAIETPEEAEGAVHVAKSAAGALMSASQEDDAVFSVAGPGGRLPVVIETVAPNAEIASGAAAKTGGLDMGSVVRAHQAARDAQPVMADAAAHAFTGAN